MKRILQAAALVYLLLLCLLFGAQRSLIFPAPSLVRRPAVRAPLELRSFTDASGLERTVIYRAPRSEEPCLVYFHGNGLDNADLVWMYERFSSDGFCVVGVEYPGYGWPASNHERTASEQGLYASGVAALEWLRTQGITRERTVLIAHSLGTGVAMELASRGYGARLVLLSPYVSMGAMAQRTAPIFPARWLVRDRFDSLSKAPRVRVPTLVVHGTLDPLIPISMGKLLAERIANARFVELTDRNHFLLAWSEDPIFALVGEFARGAEARVPR